MSDTAKMEIKPHTLRALACDIEDCHNPQSWADYCRAAAATLETQAARIAELEAALQARVAELEGALKDAARILHKAGEQFSAYANQHAAYKTAVSDLKAAANKEWAERCFNAHDAALERKKDE